MLVWIVPLLLAGCREPVAPVVPVLPAAEIAVVSDTAEQDVASDPPEAEVDVVVVGAGPAGLAAAWEAREQGASVLVLEREAEAGGAGAYATRAFGVATRWQEDGGLVDSVSLAADDWHGMTGGDASDPAVVRLFEESAEMLEWLETFGVEIQGVSAGSDGGSVGRAHQLAGSPIEAMVEGLGDAVRLGHRVERLVVDDGAVIGVAYADEETFGTGWIRAGATVIATGGFARDLDAVRADRPELDGLRVLWDAAPSSDGGGLPLLAQVGAASQNPGQHGVYLHGTADWNGGNDVVLFGDLAPAVMVDAAGERVAAEDTMQRLDFSRHLFDATGRRVVAVMPEQVFETRFISSPGFVEVAVSGDPDDLLAAGVATVHDTPAELAAAWDLDAAGLEATLERYETQVAAGLDEDFGKDPGQLVSFAGHRYVGVELFASASKAFGGAALDLEGRVLDEAGLPIPGLYAAGEVAGMLGSAEVGSGFDGSITACYLTGRVAGRAAAGAR